MSKSIERDIPEPSEVGKQILDNGEISVHEKLDGLRGATDNEEQVRWTIAWYTAEVSVKESYSDDEEEAAKTLVKEASNQGVPIQQGDIVDCQRALINENAPDDTSETTPSSANPKDSRSDRKDTVARTQNVSRSASSSEPEDEDRQASTSLPAFSREIQTTVRDSPEEKYDIYDRLTRESRLSQDTIGVERVREDGIAVRDDVFIGIAEITPRNWFVLNEDRKSAVYSAYVRHLLSLTFPVQELILSKAVDLEGHLEHLKEADLRDSDASPILSHSREKQAFFETRAIAERGLTQNKHYVLVKVEKGHIEEHIETQTSGRLPRLSRLLSKVSDWTPSRSNQGTVSDEECANEVKARLRHIEDTLSNTGVTVESITSRTEMMDILYYAFNNQESPFEEYNQSKYVGFVRDSEETL